MLVALLLLQGASQVVAGGSRSRWTYAGPYGKEHWEADFPDCGGTAQSPIDIQTGATWHDPSLLPVLPLGYGSLWDDTFTLHNNGHTVKMSLPPTMTLQGLPWVCTAVQLHLHWGRQGQAGGSEHRLDGEAAPAELHVVHYNSETYANLSQAQHQADGLAVLGILIEAGDTPNPAYDNILRHLDSVQHAGQSISIPAFDVGELLPQRLGHFYRYNGSLTTPPCLQSVLWTVFHQRVRISSAQLQQLQQTLFSTELGSPHPQPLLDNFREPQALNDRLVLASFPVGPTGYSTGEIIAIVFGVLVGCLGVGLAAHFVAKRIRTKRRREHDVVFKSSSKRVTVG
ncbi:carbonic anhydrase 14 isoform X1 [Alligator sinensis]|uniref:carbonic anhydrase n=2 Tax=Alligator sinensis TaxID=38654 RepID=A0A1U7SJ67_ALLSI|nr:carbonic anhydrase 14 isoform X1 [Alligator sinensis]